MINQAIDKGILEAAKENAEEIVGGMLKSTNGDYEIVIEWQ